MSTIWQSSYAQLLQGRKQFSRADSLRGMLSPERNAYDVTFYNLDISINPKTRELSGSNTIHFTVVNDFERMQVDLFPNMRVDKIIWNDIELTYEREFGAVFITIPQKLKKGSKHAIAFYYSGRPQTARRAPWDGGFVWSADDNGKDWIGVACQGTGASMWWPNKDHQSDEPDSMRIAVAVPKHLKNISNGRLRSVTPTENDYLKYEWFVSNPINNYNVTVNIGDYAHIQDVHNGLSLDYYVLPYNVERAKKHFAEVKPMMDCFEEKFGEYPFRKDGFKLIETPYLGMEHQSAIAYGNKYRMGYLGSDLSGTGIGLLFDYITIHESGHEWFGNSLTTADIADMWIHEGFTVYTEAVYVECRWGKDKALEYLNGIKKNIENKEPIIGTYNVNSEGSGDMYYKGAMVLNTLRSIVNNDEKWWKIIKNLAVEHKKQIVTSAQIEKYFSDNIGMDLIPVFDQYLRNASIPVLEYQLLNNEVKYRWKTTVPNFSMPIKLQTENGKYSMVTATNDWKSIKLKNTKEFRVPTEWFYVEIKQVN